MNYNQIFDYARELDTILILNGGEGQIDRTFFYLTQAESGIFEGSALIVSQDGLKIITSELEEESARSTGLEVIIARGREDFDRIIKTSLENVNSVGINYSALSLSMYKNLLKIIPDKEFIDVSNSILESRKKKDDGELYKLKQAAKIGSEIYEEVVQSIKEGMTEYELASKMVYEMMNAGASGPSFSTIVGFGPSSAIPHYSPSDRKLKKGDFVLTDYGALYKGYCSDITRTAVFGRADDRQKEMYRIVKEAQEKSMNTIREDVNGKDVDDVARKVIDSTQYKGRFIHSLGHGLGLDVHDHPALAKNYDFTLKDRMVVTVEPGIYVPKYGGVRIEDDVIVRRDGFEKITSGPSDLLEIS